jgi:putative ABC transport system ATP-binding protein
MSVMIRIRDLWKKYEDKSHNGAALAGVNVDIAAGEIIVLYGKSGSGKTTLLNIVAGLDRPTGGVVEIDGQNLLVMGDQELTDFRRQKLGFVFQFFNLLPTLTALENVYLALELMGRGNKSLAREALASVGLGGKEGRFPHELSGGEQQRVAVARAIVKQPSVILADEPTGNLDNRTGEQILELLYRQSRTFGATLVMASHSTATAEFGDRILTMADGLISEQPRFVRE